MLRSAPDIDPPKVSMANHPPLSRHAHFSDAEVESARNAFECALAVVRSSVVINPKASAMRLRAERDTGAVPLAICGGYPERPFHSDGSTVSRQQQLDAAWFHRERAIADSIPAALDAVDGHPGRELWVQAAKDLKEALRRMKLVDPNLPYIDPTPQSLLTLTINDSHGNPLTITQTSPAVVGPHGDYWDAIAQSFWMSHYARDMADAANKLLESPAYIKHRPHLRAVMGTYREVQRWQLDCAAKIGGVSFTETEDRFCTLLYVADTLTNAIGSPKPGLPEHYFAMMLQFMEMLPKELRPLFQAHSDMWRRTDDCDWGIFVENEPIRKRCGQPVEPRKETLK